MNSSRIVARILGSDNSVLSERNRLFRRNNRDNGTPKAKKVKIVSKDVYLLDKETTTMPRGADKCSLHQRKQVITAFQLEGYLTEEELYDRLEQCFSEVLDFSSPVPRYLYIHHFLLQTHVIKLSFLLCIPRTVSEELSCKNLTLQEIDFSN